MVRPVSRLFSRILPLAGLFVGCWGTLAAATPQPEVPLATALETPGREWTSVVLPLAYGVAAADASGGSVVVMEPGSRMTTQVAGPAILKLRSRGQTPSLWVNGTSPIQPAGSTTSLTGNWTDAIYLLPAGDFTLVIGGWWNTELDRAEIIAPPPTLAAALGLAEGSITPGGADPWIIAPYAELAEYGARIDAQRGHGDSWLDLPVQGPVQLDFVWKSESYSKGLALLVDGETIDFMDGARSVRIEIPTGAHIVRWLSHPPEPSDPWLAFDASLGGIQITPLPAGGRAMAALGLQSPVSVPPEWLASSRFSRDGGMALEAPPLTPASPVVRYGEKIKASFTGPGELSFWWYAGMPTTGEGTATWGFSSPRQDISWPRSSEQYGWKQERLWLPPGTSLLKWEVYGLIAETSQAALDGIHFTPSAAVPLGEALGAPELSWQNDALRPWSGFSLVTSAGNVAVSPALVNGQSARFSTVVRGPGKISFHWNNLNSWPVTGEFLVNGKLLNTTSGPSADSPVEFVVPVGSQTTLEWIATASSWADQPDSRVGVDQVVWQELPSVPLAKALDTPTSVTWRTSGKYPFSGRMDPGGKGGSSAYIGLMPGEESWLEANVNGPGLFDFWIRKIGDMDLSYSLWRYWSVSIDGIPLAIGGTSWPAQWITGAGLHRIRFTFRNPDEFGSDWLASAVDDVSWFPLQATSLDVAGGLPGKTWQTGKALPAEGLFSSGRDRGPAILLRPGQGGTSWVGTNVLGPCEIRWDSSLDEIHWPAVSSQCLRVDGIDVVPLRPHSWQRMRLTLPEGLHSIRWITRPGIADPAASNTPAAFAAWRLSGMKIKRGISPLARALDFNGLFALETGDTGGRLVAAGNDDAWEPGTESSLYFFDPRNSGKIATVWGRPDSVGGQWDYEDESGLPDSLVSDSAGWHAHSASIQPGSLAKWSYSLQAGWDPGRLPPLLKRLTMRSGLALPLATAIEAPRPAENGGWLGLADGSAMAHRNSGWSLLNQPGTSHTATLILTGPARVLFWWKSAGSGTLRLTLDDGVLPVAEPGTTWSKVEFAINPGDHMIQWTHAATEGTRFSKTGEARLDALEILPITPSSLTQVAALDPHLDLTTTSGTPGQLPWQPVIYQEPGGTWTRAARAVSGSRVLRTTVTGPAVLEFRGRCFEGYPTPPLTGPRPSVVVIGGERPPTILGHFLMVQVDGTGILRIPANASGAWQDGAVHVPAGVHEVTFRLMTLESRFWGQSFVDATAPDLQGWVATLRLTSPANRFQAWAIAKNLPPGLSGQDADADGDGASNFLEYSFGTSPSDARSRPQSLAFGMVDRGRGNTYQELRIPYLPTHVSGTLESSADLIHWQTEPTPLLHDPPLYSWFNANESTTTYQSLPIATDSPGKFYRILISDRPPAE